MADETSPQTQATPEAATDTDTTPAPSVDAAPETPSPAPAHNGLPTDVAELHTMIHNLRAENARDRTTAKANAAKAATDDVLAKINTALGLTADTTPTVDELTAQLEQERATNQAALRQFAVYKAAQGIADVDMLLDSRQFTEAIAEVDTTNPEALTSAITEFVTAHPKFGPSAQAAPGPSTAEHAAGSGETTITREQFKAMTGQERNALYTSNPELYKQLAQ